jgi:hypothetical protein
LITFLINHIYCHLICTFHELRVVNTTEEVYLRNERVTKKRNLDSYKEGISSQKDNYKLLHIPSQIDFPKVRIFLESIARGSKNSKGSYEIGLKHLQCFLDSISSSSTSNNNNNSTNGCYHHYDIETILLVVAQSRR